MEEARPGGNDEDDPMNNAKKRSRLATLQGSERKPTGTDQKTVNVVLLKGYLQLAQYFRDVLGILVWIFYVPKEHAIIKAMKAEGQRYDTDVKKKGKGQG